jgi:hypothetical protein
MKKYTFTTDFETISENIGVSTDRCTLFVEKAKEVSMRALMFDKSITEQSQVMEIYLNEIQPENDVEAFYSGVIYMDIFTQTQNVANKFAEMIGQNS